MQSNTFPQTKDIWPNIPFLFTSSQILALDRKKWYLHIKFFMKCLLDSQTDHIFHLVCCIVQRSMILRTSHRLPTEIESILNACFSLIRWKKIKGKPYRFESLFTFFPLNQVQNYQWRILSIWKSGLVAGLPKIVVTLSVFLEQCDISITCVYFYTVTARFIFVMNHIKELFIYNSKLLCSIWTVEIEQSCF